MLRSSLLRLVPAILLLVLPCVRPLTAMAAVTAAYAVTDIGGIADGRFASLANVYPAALDEAGAVAANASDGAPDGRQPICCAELAPLPGDWIVPFTAANGAAFRIGRERNSSRVADIGRDGVAVGVEGPKGDGTKGRAAVWRDGEIERLPSLGGDWAIADGINAAGDIVGASRLTRGGEAIHAVLWRDGQAVDLGTLGGADASSIARDIHDAGVIAGASIATAVRYQPVLWVDGQIVALPLPQYWVAGEALAVNATGVAVGGGFLEFSEAPMRWANGAYEQLPGFVDRVTGVARDIADDGTTVGRVYVSRPDYSGFVAVRWDAAGVSDLNTLIPPGSGYVLTDAVSVNARGQILVAATKDGLAHALVLTPVRSGFVAPAPGLAVARREHPQV